MTGSICLEGRLLTLLFTCLVLAWTGAGCSRRPGRNETTQLFFSLRLAQDQAANRVLARTREALERLRKGEVIEDDLYDAAGLLVHHRDLDLATDSLLVNDARDYFLTAIGPQGPPWGMDGCLPQTVSSGLIQAGVPPENPAVRRLLDDWVGASDEKWQGKGWGECKYRSVKRVWWLYADKPLEPGPQEAFCTPEVDLEFTMKSLVTLAESGRSDIVRSKLEAFDLASHMAQPPPPKAFWTLDGYAWVIFASEHGVPIPPELVTTAARKLRALLDDPEQYPLLRDSPYLLSNAIRALLATGDSGRDLEKHLRSLLDKGREGYWPIIAPKDPSVRDVTASGSLYAYLALKQYLETATTFEPVRARSFPEIGRGIETLQVANEPAALRSKKTEVSRKSLEYVVKSARQSIQKIDRSAIREIDLACRNWADEHVLIAYYELLYFLQYGHLFSSDADAQAALRGGLDTLLELAKRNRGLVPAHDTLCTGMTAIHSLAAQGHRAGEPFMDRHVGALLDLQTGGGWLHLQSSHGKDEHGNPFAPETEKTAKAIVALLYAGKSLNDPALDLPLQTLPQLILNETYKEKIPLDWHIGAAWSLLLYKKIGIPSPEVYAKLLTETASSLLDGREDSFHQSPYMIGLNLLALQGLLPTDSDPMKMGYGKLLKAWNGEFFASDATVYTRDFGRSGMNSLFPSLAFLGLGFDGRLFPFENVRTDNCGLASIARTRRSLIVEAYDTPVLVLTRDSFRSFEIAEIKRSGKFRYSLAIPKDAGAAQALADCGNLYWKGPWVQL